MLYSTRCLIIVYNKVEENIILNEIVLFEFSPYQLYFDSGRFFQDLEAQLVSVLSWLEIFF